MRARHAISLIAVFTLLGCDRITGAADQKILDAQAIGYACRVSMKAPEDCMKENEAHSPSYVLAGWKKADRDIEERVIDPSMGKHAVPPVPPANRATPAVSKEQGKLEAQLPPGKIPIPKAATPEQKPATTKEPHEKNPAH